MESVWVEWLGYLASVIVLVSLTMASIVKLRWINLFGALLFSIYGFLIDSIPVALLNFGIVVINIYYLYKYYTFKERFDFVDIDINSDLFDYFLNQYKDEIEQILPVNRVKDAQKGIFLMRDSNIAGIIVGNRDNQKLEIVLDFVIPQYRDFKLGYYFFVEHKELFIQRGIKIIQEYGYTPEYIEYLQKMGFEHIDGNRFEKIL